MNMKYRPEVGGRCITQHHKSNKIIIVEKVIAKLIEKCLIPLQVNVDIRAEVTQGKHMFPTDTPVPDIP